MIFRFLNKQSFSLPRFIRMSSSIPSIMKNFTLLKEQKIPEINSYAKLYKHKTGAQILSVENDDTNKVFGINFFTPPPDSSGIPHIMEHSVLCGSRKYNVKEPFVILLKSSLNTFLNAFTYPDRTCYPVSSQNVSDFYNLIDVYMDAVLYPNITHLILKQEGYHTALDEITGKLTLKGVVLNEMKGVYSNPDDLLERYTQISLFPDNIYRHDSGGHPASIPSLTYENFKKFHEEYYHPSNAFIYFYGNDNPIKRFEIIQSYLKDFKYPMSPINKEVELQIPFQKPRYVEYKYDGGENADEIIKKSQLCVSWVLPQVLNGIEKLESLLSYKILSFILVGLSSSPLRKELIDSGLGEDLAGNGVDDDLCQVVFSTGLKGIKHTDAQKVEELILSVLKRLVDNGIGKDMVEAAMNSIEFNLRENNTGYYPRGLSHMLSALKVWLYNGDPIDKLAFEKPLNAIKKRYQENPYFFESVIQQVLLSNNHRTTLLLKPDISECDLMMKQEREALDKYFSSCSEDEKQDIVRQSKILLDLQAKEDSPEAIATLPMLKLDDLDKKNQIIPSEVHYINNKITTLYHNISTNGILYFIIGFNLKVVSNELLPFVPIFGRALFELGTQTEDYVQLIQRIAKKTGGISSSAFSSSVMNSNNISSFLLIHGKSDVRKKQDLLDILKDVLLTVKLDNRERFRQIVLEAKAEEEGSIIPLGHRIVSLKLRSMFNQADHVQEKLNGISQLFFLRRLIELVDKDWPRVLRDLEHIKDSLLTSANSICNVTLDLESWKAFQKPLSEFLSYLPHGEDNSANLRKNFELNGENEGLVIPSQVNYVGKAVNLYEHGYKPHGSIYVLSKFLNTNYLWNKVRVMGGAYGCFWKFDIKTGVLTLVSYRDPNLINTLNVYDAVSDHISNTDISQDELVKIIIGTIGEFDKYQLPDAKGYTSLVNFLSNYSDDYHQELRDQILCTDDSELKSYFSILKCLRNHGKIIVLGSSNEIEKSALNLKSSKVL